MSDLDTEADAPTKGKKLNPDMTKWKEETSSHVASAVGTSAPRRSGSAEADDDGYEADADTKPKRARARDNPILKRVARTVTRTDATIDDKLGSYGGSKGKPKAHRTDDGLQPAGDGTIDLEDGKGPVPVTTRDHLLGSYPVKGGSKNVSFANEPKALQVRDYSQTVKGVAATAEPPKITLKARKLMNAIVKGKPDVKDVNVLMTNDLVRAARADPKATRDTDPKSIIGDGASAVYKDGVKADKTELYARRDAEVHTVGKVPKRFMKYSDRKSKDASESDSDSVSEAETEYSDLEDDAPTVSKEGM